MDKSVTVNGKHKLDWDQDLTISRMLKEMEFTYKLLIVKINDKVIKKNKYDTFRIPAGADVRVIHMMSGG
jgi:thiamine biosynthesis protein ThiS